MGDLNITASPAAATIRPQTQTLGYTPSFR